jgi:hypothetical protein
LISDFKLCIFFLIASMMLEDQSSTGQPAVLSEDVINDTSLHPDQSDELSSAQ